MVPPARPLVGSHTRRRPRSAKYRERRLRAPFVRLRARERWYRLAPQAHDPVAFQISEQPVALAISFVALILLILAALLWARKRRGGEPGTAPGWAFRPLTGWLYLIVYVASFLVADSGGVHSTLQVLGAGRPHSGPGALRPPRGAHPRPRPGARALSRRAGGGALAVLDARRDGRLHKPCPLAVIPGERLSAGAATRRAAVQAATR